MPPKQKADLSKEDIIFLKTVHEIESKPENYDGTDAAPAPANTSVLNSHTPLSKTQIKYRMLPGERGLEKLGYLRLHETEATQQGFTPRSVELTDEGRKAIMNWEEKHGELDPDAWDQTTVKDIELEIDRLRKQVENLEGGASQQGHLEELDKLSARLDAIEDSEFGAVDEESAEKLQRTISWVIAMRKAFEDVLGFSPGDLGDDVSVQEARVTIRENLRAAGSGGTAQPANENGGQTQPPEE